MDRMSPRTHLVVSLLTRLTNLLLLLADVVSPSGSVLFGNTQVAGASFFAVSRCAIYSKKSVEGVVAKATVVCHHRPSLPRLSQVNQLLHPLHSWPIPS